MRNIIISSAILICGILIFQGAFAQAPNFKLNGDISVSANPINKGSYVTVICSLKNTGTSTGPFDFECDLVQTNGNFVSVIGKKCNNSGYTVNVNSSISLTFDINSTDASAINAAAGSYKINIIASNVKSGCPACGTKTVACISSVGSNGFTLPYPVTVVVPPACTNYSVSPNSNSVTSAGSNYTANVSATGTGCTYGVNVSDSWIVFDSYGTSGTFNYHVNSNTGSARTGYIYINNTKDNINSVATLTISQAAPTQTCNLSAPIAQSASNISSASFYANWQQPSGNNNSYFLQVATDNGFSNVISSSTYSSSPATIINLNPQTNYFYRLNYSDGSCTSPYSNTVQVQTNQVVNNQPPAASFSISGTNRIKAGDVVQFNGSATNFPTSWKWNLPGGSPASSTSQNPSVTYPTPGNYRVELTACNNNGCSGTYTQIGYINVAQSSSQLTIPPKSYAISSPANQTVQDPIQIATGTYVYKHNDAKLPVVKDVLLFTRYYNSLNGSVDGPLGYGWSHSYNYFADIQKDSQTQIDTLWRIVYPDGHQSLFVPVYGGNGLSFPLYSGTTDSLRKNNGGDFTLFTKDNHRYNFSASGILTGIADLNGNTTNLSYTGNNLTGITGQGGRSLTISYNNNKISSLKDPLNRVINYRYDAAGNLQMVIDANTDTSRFVYDTNHLITAVVNPLGDSLVRNSYDSQQRVVSQKDADNKLTSIVYDSPAIRDATITFPDNATMVMHHDTLYRKTFIIDELGFRKTYRYDENSNETGFTNENNQSETRLMDKYGNLLSRLMPDNQTTNISYNSFNTPLQITDPNNNLTTLSYDANNNLLIVNRPDNTHQNFTNNSSGLRTSVKDGRGNTTSFTYSVQGDLTSAISAAGTKQFVYDVAGRLTQIINENNYSKGIGYDKNDNIISITDPLQHSVYFSYDANNQLLSSKDKNGNTSFFTYDKKGRLLTKRNARGGLTQYAYDSRDNLISIIDPMGRSTLYGYDSKNRRTSIRTALGQTRLTIDPAGNLTRITDASGKTTDYAYTANNRIKLITDGLSQNSRFTYDNNNNLVSVSDPLSLQTQYTFDPLNRLTAVLDPGNGNTSFNLDENGNKKEIKDAILHSQKYTYDPVDRLSNYKDGANNSYDFTYDPGGSNISIIKPNGYITKTYDSLGRIITVNNSTGNNYRFVYDSNGNMISMTSDAGTTQMVYDSLNNLVQYTDPFNKKVLFTYDLSGKKTSIIYPGNLFVKYAYDDAGNIKTVTDWLNHVFTYQYDDAGRISKLIYPNGVSCNYVYDAAGRLLNRVTKNAKNIIITSSVFTLDAAGNRTQEEKLGPIPSFLIPDSLNYQYSADDRLLSDTIWSFTNDNAGNRTVANKGAVSKNYVFAVDNILTKYTDTSKISTNYTYDALGHRLAKSGGKTSKYVLDFSSGLSQILQITDSSGNIQSQYVYGLGLLERIDSAGKSLYYHFDGQHNTTALSNDTTGITDRYTYDPFGRMLSHTGTTKQPFTFLGEYQVEQEDSVLYYVRARYYDAGNGRFLSKDPFPSILVTSQDINKYVYVTNNPLTGFDYTGLYKNQDDYADWGDRASFGSEIASFSSDVFEKFFAKDATQISLYKSVTGGYERIYYNSGKSFLTKPKSLFGKFGGSIVEGLNVVNDIIDIKDGDTRKSKYFDLTISSTLAASGFASAGIYFGIITAPLWMPIALEGAATVGVIYAGANIISEIFGGKSLSERWFDK